MLPPYIIAVLNKL